MSDDETFDVFFSYNSKDREAVRRLRESLEAQGVRVWMDEEKLPLGQSWQPHVEAIVEKVGSVAILLGPAGFGNWQDQEARLCLTQAVKRHIPVIPVLLPGGPDPERLPSFLRERTSADLRNDTTGTRLQRLIREIRPQIPTSSAATEQQPTAPRHHNIPFLSLGDLLKGRDEELQRLVTNLQSSAPATAITQAIYGLGGIGKTRLAAEYALRSGDRYDAAFFITADSPEALQSGLAGLVRIGLPDLSPLPNASQAEEVSAALNWLRGHNRWLLILDNVDTPEAAKTVREILPKLAKGHVLITSRRRDWPAAVRRQALGELAKEKAATFLLQRTEDSRTVAADDVEQAARLAEILGGLPLALEQAAAYIGHHQSSFVDYLKNWERENEKVLEWHDEAIMDYPASVAATWQTTFAQLSPRAVAILRLTAFLAPEPIPEEMFEKGEDLVEEATKTYRKETKQRSVKQTVRDALVKLGVHSIGTRSRGGLKQRSVKQTVRDALVELGVHSMGTRSRGGLTVHRVVQEVLRARIPKNHRQRWIELSLRLVNDYSPPEPEDVRTWPVWDLLRPHVSEVLRTADEARIPRPTSALMNQLVLYLEAKGLYLEAEPLARRSLAIEEELGSDQNAIRSRLNNLAQLLKTTNRLSEAEPLMRRALEIAEASFGHPNVVVCLNNLAQLLKTTNRLLEAEPLMRRALEIAEASFGPHHPDVARILNNLAWLLQATNRLLEAEPLLRRALEIDEASFGSHHPNVARDLHNLAWFLQATNRLSEAEPLMRQALEIFEASFGPDHPRTQTARGNLESLLGGVDSGEPEA